MAAIRCEQPAALGGDPPGQVPGNELPNLPVFEWVEMFLDLNDDLLLQA